MAVYVQGPGTEKVIVLILPEAGYDVEACLREAKTPTRLELKRCDCLGE